MKNSVSNKKAIEEYDTTQTQIYADNTFCKFVKYRVTAIETTSTAQIDLVSTCSAYYTNKFTSINLYGVSVFTSFTGNDSSLAGFFGQ